MARFKRMMLNYTFRKYVEYWLNLVRNYDGDCCSEFILPVVGCMDFLQAARLVQDAFPEAVAKSVGLETASGEDIPIPSVSSAMILETAWKNAAEREKARIVMEAIGEHMLSEAGDESDVTAARFAEMKRLMKLSDLELEIATLSYLLCENNFAWPRNVGRSEVQMFFAMALDRSYEEVCEATSRSCRLRKLGIVDRAIAFNRRAFSGFINGSEKKPFERRFFRASDPEDVLPWEFFGDVAMRDGELMKRMLASGAKRCNVLLYGAPGTGKTSFARSLAREVGRHAYEIALEGGMKKGDREACVRIANEQLDADDSMIIVDEADEFLRESPADAYRVGSCGTDKSEMNMLLDEMAIPTIWIANVPASEIDESVRRRFDYSVCFRPLNSAQRESVWRNLVAKYDLAKVVPASSIAGYSSVYDTSAGGIANALETLKRLNPRPDEIDTLVSKLMKPHCELLGIHGAGNFRPARGYSLDGLNIRGKHGLELIVNAVRNFLGSKFASGDADRPRMNLLLFGPPGTGKTEFVKYLGQTLGRKVLVKRGSDILDKYVGGTERRIADAFREAESEGAILFFDEIDGLVQNREDAEHGWQVTQVNELLQQMENFDGVMIAATNFGKNLDAAIMRRFTYKLEFGYLEDEGKRLFFERMFKSKLTDSEFADLEELENLAPGDFRTVRQELYYLDRGQTNAERISALRSECELKKDGRKVCRIGF